MTTLKQDVLAPTFTYNALRESLPEWREFNVGTMPIIPGEPEHALLERDDGARIAYTFNPVCRLRVIEIGEGMDAVLARLPIASDADIAAWLDAPQERDVLRGVLATRIRPGSALLQRVEALQQHPVGAVARAAQALTADFQQARTDLSVLSATSAIQLIEQQLRPLLQALAKDVDGTLSASLKPRPGDAALAFISETAAFAEQTYATIWAQSPRVDPFPVIGELRIHLAPAGMLVDDNALSHPFPSGYRAVASQLNPHNIWACWKYLKPDHDAGMAYDGLVWLRDHWAWFPKPYRALRQ
jgi:hypothetical protein